MAKQEFKKFYNSKQWKYRRQQQLQDHPLCALCLVEHTVSAATVADHIVPHKGNAELFYYGPLQSLCTRHHNKTKKDMEVIGYHNAVDVHGRPIDPNHPSLKTK